MPPLIYDNDMSSTFPMPTAQDKPTTFRVTLKPANNETDTREITLSDNTPVIIGRSSRSGGRQGASSEDNNALFDCPVVSRKHAELKLDSLPGATARVTITDTRSLHGTFVNGRRLAHWETTRLMHGDTLQLGSRVERAADSHEGFNIDVEVTETRPFESNTAGRFEVPYDDSEYISDEAEMSGPEDDDDAVMVTSSAKTTPDKGGDAAPTKSAPGSSISNVIDLDPESYPRAPADRQPTEVVKDSLDSAYNPSVNEGDGLAGLLRPENGTFHEEPAPVYGDHSFHNAESYQPASAQRQAGNSPAPSSNSGLVAFDDVDDDDEDDNDSDDDSYAGNYPGESEADMDGDNDSDSDDSSNSGASDHSAEEGPEVMSSKPEPSPEKASQTAAAPFTNAAVPASPFTSYKAHYDPIRGFQPAPPAQGPTEFAQAFNAAQPKQTYDRPYETFRPTLSSAYGIADDGNSSRWDVGPGAYSTYIPDFYPPGSRNFYNTNNEGALERAAAQQRALGMTKQHANPVVSDEAVGDWFFRDYLDAQREPRVRGEEPLATSAPDPYRNFSDFRGGSKAPLKESVAENKMPSMLNTTANAESTAGADAPKPNKVSIMDLVQDAASQIERRITPPTAPKHSLPSIGHALKEQEQAAGSKRKAANISADNARDAQLEMFEKLEKHSRERIRMAREEQASKPMSTRAFADTEPATRDDPWFDGWSDDDDERPLKHNFAKVVQQAEEAANESQEQDTGIGEDWDGDDAPSVLSVEFVDYDPEAVARVEKEEETTAHKQKVTPLDPPTLAECLEKLEARSESVEEAAAREEGPPTKKMKVTKEDGGAVKRAIVKGVVKPAGWMTLGGLGTMAFLCSPLAEKLVGMI